MKNLIITVACFFSHLILNLEGVEKTICVQQFDACELLEESAIEITLEHAQTCEEIQWGLMQREELPYNQGMMLYYDCPQRVSIWSFNCLIDLSIAFLDECQVIREIRHLYCYPCRMDCNRPVLTPIDLVLYPPNDPIIRYFCKQAVISSQPTKYALEMNYPWFQENGIKVGDVVIWDGCNGPAWVVRSIDIGCFKPSYSQPVTLMLDFSEPMSVWLPCSVESRDIAFLDGEQRILSIATLEGGKNYSLVSKPVVYSDGPVHGVVVALPGWFSSRGIQEGDELEFQ